MIDLYYCKNCDGPMFFVDWIGERGDLSCYVCNGPMTRVLDDVTDGPGLQPSLEPQEPAEPIYLPLP